MRVKIHSNNPRFQLKQVILESALEESAKSLWYSCVNYISEVEAENILLTVKDNKNNLEFLTKNLEDKMKAIKSQDRKAWSKIIEEEKKVVEGK
ncbi:MAG: hypothetical protein V1770_05900 [bacterium]